MSQRSHHCFWEKNKHSGMSKLRTVKNSNAWKVVKQGKDDHGYVLFLGNVLKYDLFFLWRLTDRLIQFVYWGVKGLKKYFTFLCWKMSRFAKRWGQEEGEMTFSHSGSLTPRVLAAIGLSLAINMGTDIYSKVGSPQSHKRQLVLFLLLKWLCCQIHTNMFGPRNVIEAVTASIMSPPDDYSSHSCREACSGDMEVSRKTCPD